MSSTNEKERALLMLCFGCAAIVAALAQEPEHEQLIIPNITHSEALSISSNAIWNAQSPETRADTNTVTRFMWSVEPNRTSNRWGVVIVPKSATNGLSIAYRNRLIIRGTTGEWARTNTLELQ